MDGRTHQARKRKTDDLNSDSTLLWDLLTTFRDSDEDRVNGLIKVMRTNAPIEGIKHDLKVELESAGSSSGVATDLAAHEPVQKHARRAVFDVSRLADEPPFVVPATPWTSVVSDDGLVSNLISLWITWDKLRHDWIEESLFLPAMRSRNLDSPYCSRFLVNAILAASTRYSDYEEVTLTRGTDADLLLAFVDEAKRLLGTEEVPSLPLVQGLMMLWLAVCFIGHDKEAMIYLERALATSKQLAQYAGAEVVSLDQSQHEAIRKTIWGVFAAANEMALLYKIPALIDIPNCPMPTTRNEIMTWSPYGSYGPSRPYCVSELFERICSLSHISHELIGIRQNVQSGIGLSAVGKRIDALSDRLAYWRRTLPAHLLPSIDTGPSVFILHTNYQVVNIYIAELLEQYEPMSAAHKEDGPRLGAAREIANICALQQSLYGSRLMCVYHAHPALQAVSILIRLGMTTEDEVGITNLCIFLRSMSRRWPLIMAIMRTVQIEAETVGKPLPTAVLELFREFEKDDWTSRSVKRVDSLYPATTSPAPLQNGRRKPTLVNVTEFLDSMENLRLATSTPSQQYDA